MSMKHAHHFDPLIPDSIEDHIGPDREASHIRFQLRSQWPETRVFCQQVDCPIQPLQHAPCADGAVLRDIPDDLLHIAGGGG